MTIEAGQPVPNVMLKHMTADGIKDISTGELLEGRKVIMFGLPGAYTPVCSTKHLPSFIAEYDRLRANGVDAIACVAVNDPFVMSAWGQMHGASGKVMMLSDPDARLTSAMGFDLDLSGIGLGTRSQRYSMVVENGVAQSVKVEKSIFDHEATSASNVLASASS